MESLVYDELDRAKAKWPNENCNLKDCVMFMVEEAGEAVRAVNQMYHENKKIDHVRDEVIQTIVTAYRVLEHIDRFSMTDKEEKEFSESLPEEPSFIVNEIKSYKWARIIRCISSVNSSAKQFPEGHYLSVFERTRQARKLGYTNSKDNEYVNDELLYAGIAYMYHDISYWPWGTSLFKENGSTQNNLRRAAGLLFADWTRLLRVDNGASIARIELTAQQLIQCWEVIHNMKTSGSSIYPPPMVRQPEKNSFVKGSPLNPKPVNEGFRCDPDTCKIGCCLD